MTTQSEKAERFRALHASGTFVIPNPWDAGTAKILASLGFAALATTSAGAAFAPRALPDRRSHTDAACIDDDVRLAGSRITRSGSHLEQRQQREGAPGEPRVRDGEARLIEDGPLGPEHVEVEGPRPESNFVVAAHAPERHLDAQELLEERRQRQRALYSYRCVEEVRLRRPAHGSGLVDARAQNDAHPVDAVDARYRVAHRRETIAEIGAEPDDDALLEVAQGVLPWS